MQAPVKLQRAWLRVVLVWGDLCLWFTGWPHLWSRRPHGKGPNKEAITYKRGYGPWRFAPIYATTYLFATLAGYGVVSLSRAWYERSFVMVKGKTVSGGDWSATELRHRYPFAAFMTRFLNWLLPGDDHGAHTGDWLWGTASRRNMRT